MSMRISQASAQAVFCAGQEGGRFLDLPAAAELDALIGSRGCAGPVAADGGAKIWYVDRRRTSRPLAHRARASPGRGDAYRTHPGADGKIPQGQSAAIHRAYE